MTRHCCKFTSFFLLFKFYSCILENYVQFNLIETKHSSTCYSRSDSCVPTEGICRTEVKLEKCTRVCEWTFPNQLHFGPYTHLFNRNVCLFFCIVVRMRNVLTRFRLLLFQEISDSEQTAQENIKKKTGFASISWILFYVLHKQ